MVVAKRKHIRSKTMENYSLSKKPNNNPIIIGGNGGSGTRVVAEILLRAGVFLGHDLNSSNDNLLFTYLFKHPNIFFHEDNTYLGSDCPESQSLLKLHEKLFFKQLPSTISEWKLFLNAGLNHTRNRYNWRWVRQRWLNIVKSQTEGNNTFLWGWKEPQTIFFLKDIKKIYPQAKFILIVRDGLDMVYNKNIQQMQYWSNHYQINSQDLSNENRFEYWYRSNRQTIDLAFKLFSKNFMIVKFEDLCLKKISTITQIFDFIGLEDKPEKSSKIYQIPQIPNSYQIHLQFDTKWIDSETKSKLANLGY